MECIPPDYHKQHLEYALPKCRADKSSVLILAGDIWKFSRPESYINFFKYIENRFRAIIYVHGNHEFYHSSINGGDAEFIKYIQQIPNFHYLQGQRVHIDNVIFIGTTLWTDFYKNDQLAKWTAERNLNDYPLIEWDDTRVISPEDIYEIHQKELVALTKCLETAEYFDGTRTVVVTHHGCSYKSIHPKYENSGLMNYAFTSDLDDLIQKYQPDFWIHGHTHESFDYNIGKTNVIVNPVGYKNGWRDSGYENVNYNSKLTIQV